jgi:hypothetical protein
VDGKDECLKTIGGERFVEESGGCLSLISSGESAEDSELVDASADGSDVFFVTQSSLVSQDYGLRDIYDARVDGGFPEPGSPPAECEGEACQGAASSPAGVTPASAVFQGPGNAVDVRPVRCSKGKVRRKGHCVRKRKRAKHAHRRASHRSGRATR